MSAEVKMVNKNFMMIFQESFKDGWDLTFYRYSPVIWMVAITILVAFSYWLLSIPYNFLNPEIVGNTMCDLNCVNTAWKKIMTFNMDMSISIAGLFAMVYLSFFKAKVYKDAKFFRSVQTSAFIIFAFLSFRMAGDMKKFFTPEFQTQIQMVYKPQNFKTTAERGIASQKGFGKVD